MVADIPLATYRLQLTADVGFDDAARLVPYLSDLGISHLYASPFLKARAGSTHGYDIVDHAALNPEFGGEAAFDRLSAALQGAGMGLILDFVPNHMGVGFADNLWWLDVLEWGPKSPHAAAFDIDWEALPHRRSGGVLLPILGRPYGDALENGEIELKYDAAHGSFSAFYFEHKLPINPHRYGDILTHVVAAADAGDTPAGRALLDIAGLHRDPSAPSRRDAPAFKQRIAAVPGAAEVIERGLAAYRADHEAGVAALHRLLERQHYRLAYWRVAFASINYRRFFDVNDLAGLRVEDPRTFRAVHELVARLVADGRLQGLRLDHIDGLYDPMQYARRLRHLIRQVNPNGPARPFYTLVEKILAEGETMPPMTGVDGTTGYEWLNVISRVLVDGRGLPRLDETWRAFTGERRSFEDILDGGKHYVLDNLLASEFNVLAQLLSRIAAGHYSTRDFTLERLRAALQFYVLEFPIYRTYIARSGASAEDRAIIERTVARARARWTGPDPEIFDFLRDAITLDLVSSSSKGYSAPRIRRFAFKLQQFTGPMMAKSLEDTTFYRFNRLLALNEVGGDPVAPALSAAEFHARMASRATAQPYGMTATATHDTKRGEDARARLLVLSEIPDDWGRAVEEWRRHNERLAVTLGAERMPSRNHEYMIYQALLGAWPAEGVNGDFVARMESYALKAAREGKVGTSWNNPREPYEAALGQFIRRMLDPGESKTFLDSFEAFARRVMLVGHLNSLSQLTLKAMMPGVPDFYQGTEFWDLSLVDPDNRRAVDFDRRMAALDTRPDWPALAANWADGRIKLQLTRRLLDLRRRDPSLFTEGAYAPVEIEDDPDGRVIAFSRSHGTKRVIVLVLRHFAPLLGAETQWQASNLHGTLKTAGMSQFTDALGTIARPLAEKVEVAELFTTIPVAVLRTD
jgi:(1->4)-alpha-D-glucan 1-alpha-D-glucosylmutase